jgi:hypothetical protein
MRHNSTISSAGTNWLSFSHTVMFIDSEFMRHESTHIGGRGVKISACLLKKKFPPTNALAYLHRQSKGVVSKERNISLHKFRMQVRILITAMCLGVAASW